MGLNFVQSVIAFSLLAAGCEAASADARPDATSTRDAAVVARDAVVADGATFAVDAGVLADDAGSADAGSVLPLRIGDACTADGECPAGGSGTATCLSDWPGGYCAVVECAQHGHDCPEDPGLGVTASTGSKCVLDPLASCLALCATDTDCRPEYECAPRSDAAGHGTTAVCVPRGV